MRNFTWICPFCFHSQVVSETNISTGFYPLSIGEHKYDDVGLSHVAIACLNRECREVYLKVSFSTRKINSYGQTVEDSIIQKYTIRPESSAKIFPDYIPKPLREDYVEACRIRTLSPKASATLARRCLQGAIRDFCGISKSTLDAEIKALYATLSSGTEPRGVTHESIEAIDHVRKIGNIGAHMEKDINLIVEIDEGEAQSLIDLIEILFEEWYIEREKRSQRLTRLKEIRVEKDAQKEGEAS